nr:uncharacterized protein LOC108944212 [Nicotiana tomentosiformis]
MSFGRATEQLEPVAHCWFWCVASVTFCAQVRGRSCGISAASATLVSLAELRFCGVISTGAKPHQRWTSRFYEEDNFCGHWAQMRPLDKLPCSANVSFVSEMRGKRRAISNSTNPQAVDELARSQPTDEQGQLIMPSEEETLSLWLNVVGGVYKGRAYGLSSERNFHRLACGLQGIGTSATMQNEDLEEIRRMIQQLFWNYAVELEKRKHEEKIRDALRNDIDSLKAQVNHLIDLPHSPPKSHIHEEDESDGNNINDEEDKGESEDEE